MESLAYLAVMLMMTVILGGPVGILLTLIRPKNIFLIIIKRLLHGFVIAMSLIVGSTFLFNTQLPLPVHLIGLFGVAMAYIAIRREYFPDVRIIAPLLARVGLRRSSDSNQQHGPTLKWRRNGRSGGNDGHGPEGQH
jgi:hypothetical protein